MTNCYVKQIKLCYWLFCNQQIVLSNVHVSSYVINEIWRSAVNLRWPRQWDISPTVKVMTCLLSDVKTSLEPMMTYYYKDLRKFESKCHERKYIWICPLENVVHLYRPERAAYVATGVDNWFSTEGLQSRHASRSRTCRDACRDRYLAVSFEVDGRENVPGIPGACATRNFTYFSLLCVLSLSNFQNTRLTWHPGLLASRCTLSIVMKIVTKPVYFQIL